ncbi:MAG: 50S ribosomal protein L24 [Candidatus Cryptobacteroides sp.]
MKKFNIKKGDTVMVITGKYAKKTGKVLSVLPKEDRVVVENMNMVKKHTKPNAKQPQGGIIAQEAPIHISNVQLIDPVSQQRTRVGYKFVDGKKIRYAKKSGEEIK